MRKSIIQIGIAWFYALFLSGIFQFSGWFVDWTISTVWVAHAAEASQYSVLFSANGWKFDNGSTATSWLYVGTMNIQIPIVKPTRSWYDFVDWYTSSSWWNKIDSSMSVSRKTTYYAHWNKHAANYIVQFNANGWKFTGTNSSKKEFTFSGSKSLSSHPLLASWLPTQAHIEKQWYEFAGWFTTSSSVGWEQPSLSTVVSSKKTYYARWNKTAAEYQVILDADGWKFKETKSSSMKFNFRGFNQKLESNSSLIGILVKSDATPEAVLEKSGYKFLGWYTKKSAGWEKINKDSSVSSKTTYYARWNKEAPKYSVIFHYNGWESPNHKEYEERIVSGVNTQLGTLPTTEITRMWYTLLVDSNNIPLWNTKQNGKWSTVTPSTTVSSRTFYYAQWNKIEAKYPITFHANGWKFKDGSLKVTLEADDNKKVNSFPTEDPIQSGYTKEDGWYTSTWVKVTKGMIVGYPMTFYAKWNKNASKYIITFSSNGWKFNREGNTDKVRGTDYIVNATYENESVKKEYTDNDTFGNVPTQLGNELIKSWYKFIKWSTSWGGGWEDVTRDTKVTNSKTVYAQWTPKFIIRIDVTGWEFNVSDGKVEWGWDKLTVTTSGDTKYIEKEYVNGDQLGNLPQDPTKTGKTFDWWKIKNSSTSVSKDTFVRTAFVIEAKWK